MKCCHSTVTSFLQACQLLWDKYRLLCRLLIITLPSSEFLVPYPHLQAFLLKFLQWLPLNIKPTCWHDQSPAYFSTLFCTSFCSPSVGHTCYLPEPQLCHFVSPLILCLIFFSTSHLRTATSLLLHLKLNAIFSELKCKGVHWFTIKRLTFFWY